MDNVSIKVRDNSPEARRIVRDMERRGYTLTGVVADADGNDIPTVREYKRAERRIRSRARRGAIGRVLGRLTHIALWWVGLWLLWKASGML